MKRVICAVLFVAILLLNGCGQLQKDCIFYCTQERICEEDVGSAMYAVGVDTGIAMPGLKQNFVPQGICHLQENKLIISGYFMPASDVYCSALLAVDCESGALLGEYTLVDSMGKGIGGHFSGVAATERDLYVTGPKSLYRISLKSISEIGSRGALKVEEELPIDISADACNYSAGELWVCEYYQEESYLLEPSHRILCADGQEHHAWMICYAVEDGLEIKCIMSIPDKIQGITMLSDGRLCLSQSYGRENASALLLYDDPRSSQPDAMVNVEGEYIPLWHLDDAHLLQMISIPPMSEGCCAVDGGIYLIFESAAYYYNGMDPDKRSTYPIDTVRYYPFQN